MKYDYNITQNDFLLWSDKYRKYKNNKKLMFLAMKLSILMVISIFIILFAQFKIKYKQFNSIYHMYCSFNNIYIYIIK